MKISVPQEQIEHGKSTCSNLGVLGNKYLLDIILILFYLI